MVIFFVVFEVFGQVSDTLSEDRNLYFRRTRITFAASEFRDEFLFLFSRNRHRNTFFIRPLLGWALVKPYWRWKQACSPIQRMPGCRPAGLEWRGCRPDPC